MQLTFINGSPRGKNSNTGKFMDNFIRGFLETDGNNCDVEYLVHHRKDLDRLVTIFSNSENVIIAFPLYVDAMPGSTKEFMEALVPIAHTGTIPALGFMSQCGFPETHHLRFVERYLEKYTRKLGCNYIGSIMKGGGEGLHIQPGFLVEKSFELMYEIGLEFGKTGSLNPILLEKLAQPESLEIQQIQGLVPYVNEKLWDGWLAENDALDKSFDRPWD